MSKRGSSSSMTGTSEMAVMNDEELLLIRQQLQPNISKQFQGNPLNSTTSNSQQLPSSSQYEGTEGDGDHHSNYNRTTTATTSSSTTTKSGSVLTNRSKTNTSQSQLQQELEDDDEDDSKTNKSTGVLAFPTNVPKRIKTTSVRERKKIGKHLNFQERPDWIKSRYFYFTFFYGLFYLIGAIVGYQRKKNLFCLIISGFLGLLFLAFSILHGIDYYSGAPLESVYVSLPFIISLFFCILMACFYAIGSVFKTALLISIVCGVATVFYGYALVKDYSDGSYYKENTYVQPKETEDMQKLLSDFDANYRSEADSSVAVDEVQPAVNYKPSTMRQKGQASISSAISSAVKATKGTTNHDMNANTNNEKPAGVSSTTKFFNAMNRNTMSNRSHAHSSRYEAFTKKGIKMKETDNKETNK